MPWRVRDACEEFSGEFAETVWPRGRVLIFAELHFAAALCVGRRTICRLLRFAGAQVEGHWCSLGRVRSRRR